MAITVGNLKTHIPGPATAVRIDRRTALGNPFRMAFEGERAAVIANYEHWLALELRYPDTPASRMFAALLALAREGDLVLLCWCAPKACHGDAIKAQLDAALAGSHYLPTSDGDEADDPAGDDPTARDVDNLPL